MTVAPPPGHREDPTGAPQSRRGDPQGLRGLQGLYAPCHRHPVVFRRLPVTLTHTFTHARTPHAHTHICIHTHTHLTHTAARGSKRHVFSPSQILLGLTHEGRNASVAPFPPHTHNGTLTRPKPTPTPPSPSSARLRFFPCRSPAVESCSVYIGNVAQGRILFWPLLEGSCPRRLAQYSYSLTVRI